MRRICLLIFFAAICMGAAAFSHYQRIRLENVKPSELYAVINTQFDALRSSDFPRAYRQVSSEFKQKCNISQFSGIIRKEYPGLTEALHVEYGAVERDGNHAVIDVYFIDRKGRVIPCIYTLVNEGADWKIENIRLLQKKKSQLTLNGILS